MNQNQTFQTTFDQMISNEQNQLYKALIPYLPSRLRQFVSLYTKSTELSNTIRLFANPASIQACESSEEPFSSPLEILQSIEPYCYGKSRQQLSEISNLLVMLEMLSVMNEI